MRPSYTGERGIHLVNWEKLTLLRNVGGLGIRKARESNVALLGKLVWGAFFRIRTPSG